MSRRSAFVAAALLALSTRASAQPSIWERARDPNSARSEPLLRSIGRMMDGARDASADPETLQNFRLAALAMAELSGALTFDDSHVLLVLGHVLLDAQVGREAEVRAIAARVLDRSGSGDEWLVAEARILEAHAARGVPAEAITATTRALPLVWEPVLRAGLLRQRAEARMAVGDVRGSVVDHRAALLSAERLAQRAVLRFGLGLALERSGDLPSALAELRLAQATAPRAGSTDLSVLDDPGTFVFRPYDVHYVSALTAMAVAQSAADSQSMLLDYERALVDWERFEIAAPAQDPWLASAKLHRATCERTRQELLRAHPSR